MLLLPISASALEVTVVPPTPRQGDAVVLTVRGSAPTASVQGRLGGRPLRFYPVSGGHAAIGGIDIEAPAGRAEWEIVARDGRGASRRAPGRVAIQARDFPVQRLTLPTPMVDLDPETEAVADSGLKLSKSDDAPALFRARPAAQVVAALRFLRQQPPAGLERASLPEVWQWELAHWAPQRFAGLRQDTVSAAVTRRAT